MKKGSYFFFHVHRCSWKRICDLSRTTWNLRIQHMKTFLLPGCRCFVATTLVPISKQKEGFFPVQPLSGLPCLQSFHMINRLINLQGKMRKGKKKWGHRGKDQWTNWNVISQPATGCCCLSCLSPTLYFFFPYPFGFFDLVIKARM